MRTMGAHYHARLQAVAAAETLQALEALPRPLARSWSEILPRLGSVHIQCEGVRYRYPGRTQDALADVSLTIPPAALTVLIGPSGAGKSTLARLLLGFDLPRGGDIFVNGCNLATAEPESWRSQCGWLPQQPVLLAGSIRENIAPGEDEPDASRLWEALARVELEARVRSLPEGLETRVGQGGRGLSGGEMRRLALARLFYSQPAFVVLDEPTASLDAETEAVISRAISELARNHTVLVIAHRLQTLREADHLVMMEAGHVVAEGSPEAVAERVPAVGRLLGGASRD
ncbi:MAG: ATP-binding cassette domain-containing protein [Gammaproteobacteria bacterium]|nr:MAG: ATP-binding cassette domain-containing protein [Gammaproteobacteria bacterium]